MEETNKKLTSVVADVMSLKSRGDSDIVRFGGLGFQSVSDSGAWLETHAAVEEYGWVYNHHILMQAVHMTFSGEDLIKRLSKGYKLEIKDGHQAATIASFETSIQSFLCANETQLVIQKEHSFFTSIKSWSEWNLPHQGYQDMLLAHMEQVRSSHLAHIEDHLDPSSPLYSLAVEALQTSYTWTLGLLKFGDNIVWTYVRAKFSVTVAWHVATRLMKLLIMEVAKKRVVFPWPSKLRIRFRLPR